MYKKRLYLSAYFRIGPTVAKIISPQQLVTEKYENNHHFFVLEQSPLPDILYIPFHQQQFRNYVCTKGINRLKEGFQT